MEQGLVVAEEALNHVSGLQGHKILILFLIKIKQIETYIVSICFLSLFL